MSHARRAYAAIQRRPGATIGYLAFAIIIGVVALRGESTRDIVVGSPCTTDADGRKCQDAKRESDEVRPLDSTCVLFYKVDRGGQLLRLTKCPVEEGEPAVSPAAPAPAEDAPSTAPVAPDGGDAQNPSQAGQQPGPQGGGDAGGDGGGRQDEGAGPVASEPADAGRPPGPTSSGPVGASGVPGPTGAAGPSGPTTTTPATGALPATVEAVTGTVEGTGKAAGEVVDKAGGVVEGTTEQTCELLGRC